MSPASICGQRTSPLVFAVAPARGGSAGWASLTATNTAEKALLQHRDTESGKGLLAHFTAFILRPVQAVMRWVAQLLQGPEPKPLKPMDDFALPGLQDRNLLTSAAYATLLAEEGALTLVLRSLELIERYARTSSAEDAWDVLEVKHQGVSARDWAQGSPAAVQIVAQSDELQQFFLADDLNEFARKARGAIQHRNAQAQTSVPAPTRAQLADRTTWLGPENSLERLDKLREGLLGIRDERSRPLPAPTPLDAGALLSERVRGLDIKAWLAGGRPVDTWFAHARLQSRLEVAMALNGWADKATELLFEAEVEKLQFYGRNTQL